MEADRDTHAYLSLLCASLRNRILSSARLIEGARHRARSPVDSASGMCARTEQQIGRSLRTIAMAHDALLYGRQPSRDDMLRAVLNVARSIYPDCHAVSLTAVVSEYTGHILRYATVAHTGTAARADAAQYALDEGPCHEAIALDQVILLGSDDLTSDPPVWPRFSAAVRHLGFRSAISIGIPWSRYWTGPTSPDCPPVGAINLYSVAPYPFLAKESDAISLGVHVAARMTGADPVELYDPEPFWPTAYGH